MKFLSKLKRKDLGHETVLLRVDLNVEKVEDSLRLEASIPTIKWLTERGAKIVLLSHRGRPKIAGGTDSTLSLRATIPFLMKQLGQNINFIDTPDLQVAKDLIAEAPIGSINMLENLRFHADEEANDNKFAKQLAALGTMYVNDAFAVSHRKNASVVAISRYLPSYAGLLFEKEYATLSGILKKPAHPLIFIIGGAKTADKVPVIKNFLKIADCFLLGGGAGNTALVADGVDIKTSIYDPALIGFMKKILKSGKLELITDWLGEDEKILDIGLKTIDKFTARIKTAKTIVWNGPLGLFENPKFAAGSIAIAKAIAESNAFSIVGGGETTQLILSLGLQDKFSFLSTAGGAMLKFLAGKKLPGIEALNK